MRREGMDGWLKRERRHVYIMILYKWARRGGKFKSDGGSGPGDEK